MGIRVYSFDKFYYFEIETKKFAQKIVHVLFVAT
jgi:hypothetical protein